MKKSVWPAGILSMIPAVVIACGDGSTPTPPAENQPPTLADVSETLAEDASATVDVLAAASDPDGGTLTISSFGTPDHGAVTESGSALTYTPDADYNGADEFSVTVSDGEATGNGTVLLTITPVNDAPVANPDQAQLNEDEGIALFVVANDTDVDGDPLRVTDATASHGSLILHDEAIEYLPDSEYSGADTIVYTIQDTAGAEASSEVVLTILPVNDPPTAVDDGATGPEDTLIPIDVLANDSDPEGDSLSVVTYGQPQHGTLTIFGSILEYMPDPEYSGEESFFYTMTDGARGFDTATVTVTVTPVPDAPVASADSAETDEDVPVLIDVLANDTDADGDVLAIGSVETPASGASTVIEAGQVRYTPPEGQWESDAFTYVVEDGTGLADTATVSITIHNINAAPTASDDVLEVAEDQWAPVDVLANDTDPDGDPLFVSDYSSPSHGYVSRSEGVLHYYAGEANYYGPDSFTYTISDGALESTATVSVTVTPVNDTPVTVADSATVGQDGTVLVDVLANDWDVDGDSLRSATPWPYDDGVIAPSHGTAAWENEQVRYTPDPGYTGTDSLTYWMTDGVSGALGETLHITVVPGSAPMVTLPAAGAPVTAVDGAGTLRADRWARGASTLSSDPAGVRSLSRAARPPHPSGAPAGADT